MCLKQVPVKKSCHQQRAVKGKMSESGCISRLSLEQNCCGVLLFFLHLMCLCHVWWHPVPWLQAERMFGLFVLVMPGTDACCYHTHQISDSRCWTCNKVNAACLDFELRQFFKQISHHKIVLYLQHCACSCCYRAEIPFFTHLKVWVRKINTTFNNHLFFLSNMFVKILIVG